MNKLQKAIDMLENKWASLVGNYRYQNAEKIDNEELMYFIIECLKEKQARENPKPLTLEDLVERNDKPVFAVSKKSYFDKEWIIIYYIKNKKVYYTETEFDFPNCNRYFDFDFYDFYDYEPKGEK